MSYILFAILCFTGAAAIVWYAHCLSLKAKQSLEAKVDDNQQK